MVIIKSYTNNIISFYINIIRIKYDNIYKIISGYIIDR